VRIQNDVSKCVVFIGCADDQDEIRVVGTGFFVTYRNHGYLVTARHVASVTAAYAAKPLDRASFMIRLNQSDGTAASIEIADARWVVHPDENVDLAAVSFEHDRLPPASDCRYLPQTALLAEEWQTAGCVGIGDICYTVDLRRVLHDTKHNLALVHTGSIARLPDGATTPVRNWDDEQWLPPKRVAAYLVEFLGATGLSGSPVFVRPCLDVRELQSADRRLNATVARSDLLVLGVFQAPWDVPPSEVWAASGGRGSTLTSGIGVVVPAARIVELLETPVFRESRAGSAPRRDDAVAAPAARRPAPRAVDEESLHANKLVHLKR
jgi:hypothetical protein